VLFLVLAATALPIEFRPLGEAQMSFAVAYLLAADKFFRLLLIRLDGGTQPVSLTQNGFSKLRPCLLACI